MSKRHENILLMDDNNSKFIICECEECNCRVHINKYTPSGLCVKCYNECLKEI